MASTSMPTPKSSVSSKTNRTADDDAVDIKTRTDPSVTANNGVAGTPPAPARVSPAPPQNPGGANGSGSFVERSNAMAVGTTSPTPQTVSSKDPKAAAAAASDMRNIVRRKLTGFVGFANLPNQWHRKSVRKGFNFNVMVVGEWEGLCYCDSR